MDKKWIVNEVIRENNISDADVVILEYGLSKIFMLLEDTIFTLILGYLMGIVVESIIFQVLYMLLRMYAGGYHADTERKCKIYSALVTITSLITIRFLPSGTWLSFLFTLMVSIIVAMLAPVEAVNKPLSDAERVIYHRRVEFVIVVANLISLFSLILGNDAFYKPIETGMYVVCFLVIIGIVSNK